MAKNKSNHYVFTGLVSNIDKYIGERNARLSVQGAAGKAYTRYSIAPRTRTNDYAKALSFEVFDPLWMLARQWQYGRFKGNDCGSMVTTKIRISRRRLDSIYLPNSTTKTPYSTNTPLEYDVEKMNCSITPFVRVESAFYFRKMLKTNLISDKQQEEILKKLIAEFPLLPFVPDVKEDEKTIETLKVETNARQKQLYATFGKRTFDGFGLYMSDSEKLKELYNIFPSLSDTVNDYKKWFAAKYLPVANEEDYCWNERKLGYEVGIGENENRYEAEDYHTGRLSWYSFDAEDKFKNNGTVEPKTLSYIPVPADFPGAPNRRLWEFEDTHVQFGHQANDDFSMLANAVVMQYVTMYSNDWLLTPIEAETGTVLNVEGIITTDTFGNKVFIDQSAEKSDFLDIKEELRKTIPFIDRWSLFGTTLVKAYDMYDEKKNNFAPQGGLLFPPTVRRTEESKPIEEVQFLRDEMANMLWGVETTINDGCGGTMDGKGFSDAILSVVDENKDNPEPHGEEYDYSFLLQNRVPINWIPFIPQHIEGERRDIVFRRGKMPVFYNGNYQPVRPSTELLKYSKHYLQNTLSSGSFSSGDTSSSKSNGSVFSRFPGGNLLSNDEYVIPRYINEEEITGYGVKLVLTAQRTRWFLGESFNWVGAKKVINQYQANSGLMFDDLIEKSNKVIKLE